MPVQSSLGSSILFFASAYAKAFLKDHKDVLQTRVLIDGQHVPVEIVGFREQIQNCSFVCFIRLTSDAAHVIDLTYQTVSQGLLASVLGDLDGLWIFFTLSVMSSHGKLPSLVLLLKSVDGKLARTDLFTSRTRFIFFLSFLQTRRNASSQRALLRAFLSRVSQVFFVCDSAGLTRLMANSYRD